MSGPTFLDFLLLWMTQKIPDLGNRIARHTKGTSRGVKNPKPEIRVISKGRFKKLLTWLPLLATC